MFNKDYKSKELFERIYSDLYFNTTKELIIKRSILKSKMAKNNSLAIILSFVSLFFSFSANYVTLWRDILQSQNDSEIISVTAIVFLIFIFIGLFLALVFISAKDELGLSQKKEMLIMTEVIDLILSEREK